MIKTFWLDIYQRVTSRKFLMAVVSIIYFLMHGMADQAVGVLAVYFGANAYESNATATPTTPQA